MALHTEVPLVAFLRLTHLRIPLLLLVLRGRRSGNERGIHNGALLHEVSPPLEQGIHDLQKLLLQLVLLQEVSEVEDRGLIGDGVTEEILSQISSSIIGSLRLYHCWRK